MKTILTLLSCLLLICAATTTSPAQPATGDAYFTDWGKRFNRAWMKLDTVALAQLLPDDMVMTVCGQTGIEVITANAFVSRIKFGAVAGYNGLTWGKTSPYFYSEDTLSIRRLKSDHTVWLLQNHYYKEEWRENNLMVQDSGIISMQTTFQEKGGAWLPIASFINVIPLKKTGSWGCMTRSFDCTEYQGKRFRLQAAVRASVRDAGHATLLVRVDRKNGETGFFDGMTDRHITSPEWTVYKIEGKLDADADSLFFGGCVVTPGTAWFDEFLLEVEETPGKWMPIALENNDFETNDPKSDRPPGWLGKVFIYINFKTAYSTLKPFRGKYALEISGKPE
jgi:hypothetical protein